MAAVDYSTRIRCAEEVVNTVIDDILTEGGHMLWQKYLHRKAFPFSAETATDALVASLRMCFVAHDHGEPDDETDPADWAIEEEPQPGLVDNWARIQLTVRGKQKKYVNDMSPIRSDRKLRTQGTRLRDRFVSNDKKGDPKAEPRTFDIKEDFQVDEEEEKLRDLRQVEETRRRDKENKVKQNEKSKEAEQQRVQALHEEMSKRQHTFDSEGGLIWVEDFKMDRLPKVQEVIPYSVKKDPRAKNADNESAKGQQSPNATKKNTSRSGTARMNRTNKNKMDEDDFPDGFSKLQHGQPPILETMDVKPGVQLDVYGKTKSGPAATTIGCGMSRKEYVELCEKDKAFAAEFTSTEDVGGPDSPAGAGGPPGTAGSRSIDGGLSLGGTANLGASLGSGPEGGDILPPIGGAPNGMGGTADRGMRRTGGGGGGSRGGGATSSGAKGDEGSSKKGEVKMAPAAPRLDKKKMQAIGHLGQAPRLHVAPLGGPYGFGVAQPPLGATMGHGLVRHGSSKDAYFFPHSTTPEVPSLLRASSDTAVGVKGRGGSQLERSPRTAGKSCSRLDDRSQTAPPRSIEDLMGGMRDDEESPRHGQFRVEKKSQAYRGMRQQLFPNTLSSGYVAGMT